MMGVFNEDNTTEKMVLDKLASVGWTYMPADDLPRQHTDVMVESMVKAALIRLNPEIAAEPDRADEVIYKLSQGAHEQGERVKTSGTSNPVERTVLNCDKVLASMNREIQERREEELITPYRRVCEEIELFEIGLRSLRGRTQLVAHQLFVQRKAIPTVEDSSGKVLGRKTVEAERERALEKIAVVLEYKDRMRGGKQNGKTEYSGKSSAN